MKSKLLFFAFMLTSFGSFSQEKNITFSYWSEASPPFVFSINEDLTTIKNGIIKDLGVLIAKGLNVTPRFVNLPVLRIESQLQSGNIDLDCITNPIWKKSPNDYDWSPVLFKGADRLLVKLSKVHELAEFPDLKGKTIGIYNGYTYHPEIMKMIKEGDINTVKISGVDQGIQLLLLDRIDALIDFDVILDFKIKNEHLETLALADLYADRYELFCAYSKKSIFDKAQLDEVFQDIISKGEITKLLERYK